MNFITKFFHEFFNPHCPECEKEKENPVVEVLRQLLESEKFENKQLLNHVLSGGKSSEVLEQRPIFPKPDREELKHINRMATPWRVRQQQLEENDKKAAEILRERAKELKQSQTIEELEKELGVVEDAS